MEQKKKKCQVKKKLSLDIFYLSLDIFSEMSGDFQMEII